MTINQLINEVAGAELNATVRQTACELASVQAGCNVHSLFRPSVVDLETGRNGLRWLIARILQENGAVFSRFAVGSDRGEYVASCMTTEQIISKVRAINGFDKYPDRTIKDNLYIVMRRSNQVASIALRPNECRNRKSKRTVLAWYLVADKPTQSTPDASQAMFVYFPPQGINRELATV